MSYFLYYHLFLALAIYVRSPAAYSALKSFKILELPSIKSLQLFTAVRNHESGINEDYLAEKKADYILFSEECVKNGSKKPLGIGALIFDEVKVIGKVALNMKNEKFLGLAMNEEEMHNLHDIFQTLQSTDPVPAEYILQFLWRDITSSYDIIGPYFSLKATIDHPVVVETLMETMRALSNLGLKTACVVCDGASSNLAAIKLITCGQKGAYGVSTDAFDKHRVQPCFRNPFDPEIDTFFVICPSHQVCSLLTYTLYRNRTVFFCINISKLSEAARYCILVIISQFRVSKAHAQKFHSGYLIYHFRLVFSY